jgi:hypothetical protein
MEDWTWWALWVAVVLAVLGAVAYVILRITLLD